MPLSILSWLLLIPSVSMFQQNKFKVIFERSEVVSFNTTYVGFAKTHNFKYNRTNAVTIITGDLKVAFGNELKMELQAYRLASNEYREFPMRFMFDYCQYANKGEAGMDKLFACGNSTGCPFKKGIYTSCAWAPDYERFPPNLPAGSYMLDMKLFFRNVEVLFLQTYCTIKYPECKGCLF